VAVNRAAALAALLVAALASACAREGPVVSDAVVEVRYHTGTDGRPQRPARPTAKAWRSSTGYAFAAHRASGTETAIAAVELRQEGGAIDGRSPGLERDWQGACTVAPGYWIVDVISPLNQYLVSAVAPEDMADRRLLQHLGIARRIADDLDRYSMLRDEQLYWRTFLPVVLGNDGLVWMYGRPGRSPGAPADSSDAGGSPAVVYKRFQIERVGDLLLVGEDRDGASYRHVFTAGESYVASFVRYGQPPLPGSEALTALGLTGPAGRGPGGGQ
jgi:hypothetical protein